MKSWFARHVKLKCKRMDAGNALWFGSLGQIHAVEKHFNHGWTQIMELLVDWWGERPREPP